MVVFFIFKALWTCLQLFGVKALLTLPNFTLNNGRIYGMQVQYDYSHSLWLTILNNSFTSLYKDQIWSMSDYSGMPADLALLLYMWVNWCDMAQKIKEKMVSSDKSGHSPLISLINKTLDTQDVFFFKRLLRVKFCSFQNNQVIPIWYQLPCHG